MSKGDRGAFFAIGLGLGTAIALFFFVWAFPWFSDPTKSASYDCADDQQCSEQYHSPNDTQFWVRPFYGWIYAEDSLAQWIMAAFGIVATGVSFWAVIVVRDTLVVSRRATEAAVEAVAVTRRIGEAQVRAYLSCTGATYNIAEQICAAEITIKNFGQSPARRATVKARAATLNLENPEGDPYIFSPEKSMEFFEIPASCEDTRTILFLLTFGAGVCAEIVEDARLFHIDCVLEWVDVFDETQVIKFYLFADEGTNEHAKGFPLRRKGKMSASNTRPIRDI